MKNIKKISLAFLSSILLPANFALAYSDLSENDLYFNEVMLFTDLGIVEGYVDDTFRPDEKVARVEFLKVLYKTYGKELAESRSVIFPDIDRDSWYYSYLQNAYYQNLMIGYENGLFEPLSPITKAEALKVIYQISHDENISAQDFVVSELPQDLKDHWFEDYFYYFDQELYNHDNSLNFNPDKELSRAELLKLISVVASNQKIQGFESINSEVKSSSDFKYDYTNSESKFLSENIESETVLKTEVTVEEKVVKEEVLTSNSTDYSDLFIDQEVPFAAQAPFGEWSDIRQAEGCEEASVLMAMRWVKGETLTLEEAENEIIAMYDYQIENHTTAHDTSLADTMDWLIKGYFNYANVTLHKGIDTNFIIEKLNEGSLVIVNVKGWDLNNPYFTGKGPLQHQILIKGYDGKNEEFIVHEPGTRSGDSYRYSKEIIANSLYDYESGDLEYMPEIREKNALVITK